MKKIFKIASMTVATLLALNLNANAGAPGSGKYLAIGAILAGAAVVTGAGIVVGKNLDKIKEKERQSCQTKVDGKKLGWRVCCTIYPSMCNGGGGDDGNGGGGDDGNGGGGDDGNGGGGDTGGGTGVSEPIGILAVLTSLALFFVIRRRK
jgi:uncharacterized membrane protein YgcG